MGRMRSYGTPAWLACVRVSDCYFVWGGETGCTLVMTKCTLEHRQAHTHTRAPTHIHTNSNQNHRIALVLLEYPTNLISLTEVDLVVCASHWGHMVAAHPCRCSFTRRLKVYDISKICFVAGLSHLLKYKNTFSHS